MHLKKARPAGSAVAGQPCGGATTPFENAVVTLQDNHYYQRKPERFACLAIIAAVRPLRGIQMRWAMDKLLRVTVSVAWMIRSIDRPQSDPFLQQHLLERRQYIPVGFRRERHLGMPQRFHRDPWADALREQESGA